VARFAFLAPAVSLVLVCLASASASVARAQATATDAETGTSSPHIQDNSFLIEEAYNQDPGVVQHINVYTRTTRTGAWAATFTQEWPAAGIRHQLSTTVVLARTDSGDRGLGDFALNYRYQLVGDGEADLAVAPRLTVFLPTGDFSRSLGAGAPSVQVGLPVSTVFSPKWIAHWNAGATWTPSARDAAGERATTVAWNAGASLIYTGSPLGDALVEAVYSRFRVVKGKRSTEWDSAAFISPGVRWAYDFASGLQIVPGIAVPIGVGASSRSRQILLYLSFEHPFQTVAGH
jgi:hypothetical protein